MLDGWYAELLNPWREHPLVYWFHGSSGTSPVRWLKLKSSLISFARLASSAGIEPTSPQPWSYRLKSIVSSSVKALIEAGRLLGGMG